jgi:hypothetical protein
MSQERVSADGGQDKGAAWAELLGRLTRPGTLSELRFHHRHDCPRPKGGKCICRPDELELEIIEHREPETT